VTTLTARLKLVKPAPTDTVDVTAHISNNYDALDGYAPNTTCLSSARPATPFPGQKIWETDTAVERIWNDAASRWVQVSAKHQTSGTARPAGALLGDQLFETDTGIERVWDGTRWKPRGKGNIYYAENAVDTTGIVAVESGLVNTGGGGFTADGLTPYDIEGGVSGFQVPGSPAGTEGFSLRISYTLNAGANVLINNTFGVFGSTNATDAAAIANAVKYGFVFPAGTIVVKLIGIRYFGGNPVTARALQWIRVSER